MLIYYLFISFVFLIILADIFFVVDEKIRSFFYAVLFTIILIFIGLRYQTGLDWLFYTNLYKGNPSSLAIEPVIK